jgi:hypothetical protein
MGHICHSTRELRIVTGPRTPRLQGETAYFDPNPTDHRRLPAMHIARTSEDGVRRTANQRLGTVVAQDGDLAPR